MKQVFGVCKYLTFAVFVLFVANGCNESGSSDDTTEKSPITVEAGSDQYVPEGSKVELEGSTKGEGEPQLYDWAQVAGPKVELKNSSNKDCFFYAPVIQESQKVALDFTVTDTLNRKKTDRIYIHVKPINLREHFPPNYDIFDNPTAVLGNGYDSELKHNKVLRALTGDSETVPSVISWEMEQSANLSFKDIKTLLDYSVDADILDLGEDLFASASVGFTHTESFTKTSLSSVLKVSYIGPTIQFQPDGKLTADAQMLYDKDPGSFRKIYGDSYISEMTLGGELYITVIFQFSSKYVKDEFCSESGVKVTSLFDLRSKLDVISERYKESTQVTIHAFMKGGDGSLLADTFAAYDGLISNCSGVQLDKCKQSVDKIISWMQESSDLCQSIEENPVPIDIDKYPYTKVVPYIDLSKRYLTEEERQAVDTMYQQYADTYAMNKFVNLYDESGFNIEDMERYGSYSEPFKLMQTTTKNRMANLTDLIKISYNSPGIFFDEYQYVMDLFERSEDYRWLNLDWPLMFEYKKIKADKGHVFCPAPRFSGIVGVGLKPSIHKYLTQDVYIAHRYINDDGSLGPIKYSRCEKVQNGDQAYRPAQLLEGKPEGIPFIFLGPPPHNYFLTELKATGGGKRILWISLHGKEWIGAERRLGAYTDAAMYDYKPRDPGSLWAPDVTLSAPERSFITSFGLTHYKSTMKNIGRIIVTAVK
ncbi:PKD domain-containing protein [Desulfoluna spongiiphila]|uniref:PKD domain-containing protein n=1 Tax=Desulfoluna spongiiphila TaxID=419481 RepID=UPI00125B4132|nr:hypothetical protein [Desulfoluna spongiiphila]VVS92198.1 immunoglobulin-like fold [Desulfoluna spongiiphila]